MKGSRFHSTVSGPWTPYLLWKRQCWGSNFNLPLDSLIWKLEWIQNETAGIEMGKLRPGQRSSFPKVNQPISGRCRTKQQRKCGGALAAERVWGSLDAALSQGLECLLCAVPSLDSGGAGAQRGWVTSLRSHSWDSNPRLLPASSLRVTVKLHKARLFSEPVMSFNMQIPAEITTTDIYNKM
ncbi:uncharacterized protein LOC110262137 [Sus scrofa]|uniref:uncharacterized protein LOC110262137 n=1 Tax=Sus scrofa TaxID=9823 RepID=UPI000A2B13E0|nr:uncharacterized protein LOC110262137 [Sus scrofa]